MNIFRKTLHCDLFLIRCVDSVLFSSNRCQCVTVFMHITTDSLTHKHTFWGRARVRPYATGGKKTRMRMRSLFYFDGTEFVGYDLCEKKKQLKIWNSSQKDDGECMDRTTKHRLWWWCRRIQVWKISTHSQSHTKQSKTNIQKQKNKNSFVHTRCVEAIGIFFCFALYLYNKFSLHGHRLAKRPRECCGTLWQNKQNEMKWTHIRLRLTQQTLDIYLFGAAYKRQVRKFGEK